MLKARFLGNYFDLSDRESEVELQERLSFRVICDMYDSSNFPNHSTLCKFRNDLVKANMLEAVFDEITAFLEAKVSKKSVTGIIFFYNFLI